MYGDAVDDVGAKVLDFWNQLFVGGLIGTKIERKQSTYFCSPACIQTDNSKVSGISATGANITVAGSETSDGEWESGDMCAFVGEGIEAGYIAF